MSKYQQALSKIGDPGVSWIDALFQWCVVALVDVAGFFGVSYEALNVYLFVFLLPISLLVLLGVNIILFRRCRDGVVKTRV